ncbi:hypothetical protein [Borrelia sp. P9F1]|uniref:hypothetical protein n=1 Tax=Borrelia sp. P9F1 TaxID=3058374 RepID=UPI002649C9D6|nr:hypothetical protein [Borrelia sp. P9F1]WKC58238.1 hypothetical protein QYZ68_03600 [Borrelia sp. P9F1]
MRSEQGEGSRGDIQKTSRAFYWKKGKSGSDFKKQKNGSFVSSSKSVSPHHLNSTGGGHRVNKPKESDREFRPRIVDKSTCPMCGKQIKDIASCMSMKFDNEDKPIHFDCAVSKIRMENNLLKEEDLVYGGVGKFFVVNRLIRGSNLSFKIIREIDFENLEGRPVWRKKILEGMNRGFRFY